MRSTATTYWALLLMVKFAACSTFEPDFTSGHFDVGQVSKAQLDDFLGKPDDADTLLVRDKRVLMYSYRFANPRPKAPEVFRGVWQVPRKDLVIELVNDTLHGYIYNNSMERSSTNFNRELRARILINQANKSAVRDLLGEPAGKIGLPTSLFGHPLLKHLAHMVPQNASEAWCYYYDYLYFRVGSRRPLEFYKFLVVYFNAEGMVIDKFYSESDKTEPRITRIYTN